MPGVCEIQAAETYSSFGSRHGALLPLMMALLGLGCRAPKLPPPPLPTPVAGIVAEDLPPPRWLELEIVDLRETASADKSRVVVSGTLVNRGNRATKRINIRVDGLDAGGRTIISVNGVPASDRIAADGGSTQFSAELSSDPAVDRYHVEAVAE